MQVKIGKETEITSVSTKVKDSRLSFVSNGEEPVLEKVEQMLGRKLSPSQRRKLEIGSYLKGAEKRKWRRASEKKKRHLKSRVGKTKSSRMMKDIADTADKQIGKITSKGAALKDVPNFGTSAIQSVGGMPAKAVNKGIKAARKIARKVGETLSQSTSKVKRSQTFGSAAPQEAKEKDIAGSIFMATLSVIGTVIGMIFSPIILVITVVIAIVVAVIALVAILAVLIFSAATTTVSVFSQLGVMPYYNQGDYAAYSFCDGTIADSGCGITSMAMVVSCLTQSEVEPSDLAEISNSSSSHSLYCTVHSHSAILNFASYYGLEAPEQMSGQDTNCCGLQTFDYDYLVEKLNAGCPVIISGGGRSYFPNVSSSDWASSVYSANGHYIVVFGSGENGYYLYDPGSRDNYQTSLSSDGTELSEILRYSKHIYIFQEAAQSAVDLSGGTYAEQAFNFFVDLGYSKECAAAIVGNIWIENGNGGNYDLNANGEYTGAYYGICAWGGGRQEALMEFAASRGETDENMSFETQLLYLYQELQDGTVWGFPSSYTGERAFPEKYNLTYEEWKNCTDVEIATGAFRACFEKCYYYNSNLNAETSLPGVIPAIDYAQSVYDQYG